MLVYKEKMVVGCRRDSHDMSHEFSARQYPRCSKNEAFAKKLSFLFTQGFINLKAHSTVQTQADRYKILIYEELKITISQLGLHTLSRLRRRAGSTHVRLQARSQTRNLARMPGHTPAADE